MDVGDSDHTLMQRTGEGDITAYRQLMERHLNRSVAFAERMLGSRQDAEDVIQDVCLTIWKQSTRWQPRAKFSTWLYRVIYNACLNHRRKHIPFKTVDTEHLIDQGKQADDALIAKQQSEEVRQALQTLPERQRAALILSVYEECSDKEVADSLGISLGAAQQLLFRARQKLRQIYPHSNTEQKNGS